MSQVKQKWIKEQMEKAENDVEAMRAVIRQLRDALQQVGWDAPYSAPVGHRPLRCRACGAESGDTHSDTCSLNAALKASEAYVEKAEPAVEVEPFARVVGHKGTGLHIDGVGTIFLCNKDKTERMAGMVNLGLERWINALRSENA